MIKYVEKGSTIQIVCSGQQITLNGHLDVKSEFWKVMNHGKVNASPRAKELLKMALECDEDLWIVGDTEWAGIMGGAAYGFYEGQYKHVMVWDPSAKLSFDPAGQWQALGKTKARFEGKEGGADLENYIVALHELGHFEQFLTKGSWYTDRVATQRTEGSGVMFNSCQGDIEADNLSRNEWPICTDLGVTKRQSYWDRPGEVRLVSNLSKFGVNVQ